MSVIIISPIESESVFAWLGCIPVSLYFYPDRTLCAHLREMNLPQCQTMNHPPSTMSRYWTLGALSRTLLVYKGNFCVISSTWLLGEIFFVH